MDVELMEKELSIMIENSTESVNSHNQQVMVNVHLIFSAFC